ncbi:MAG: hypothetical protein ABIK46_03835 [candidate division WOR-3 bacterium]
MKKNLIFILIGILIIGLIVSVIFLLNQAKKIDILTKQLAIQNEEIQQIKEKEKIKKIAWKEIQVIDISVDKPLLKGGVTLYSITLYNPTDYTFVDIEYKFYDENDNVVKFTGTIAGPLPSHTTKKFYIDKWTEGLWEHYYGVEIVGAKAIE